MERLDKGTRHFPKKLDGSRDAIKNRLNNEKITFQSEFIGDVYQSRKLKNFGYPELITLLKDFSILGAVSERYDTLIKMGRFRNRFHIKNYFGNFELNESETFSEERTQKVINYMVHIVGYFKSNYSRP